MIDLKRRLLETVSVAGLWHEISRHGTIERAIEDIEEAQVIPPREIRFVNGPQQGVQPWNVYL